MKESYKCSRKKLSSMCVANEYDIIGFGGRFSSTLCFFVSTCSTFQYSCYVNCSQYGRTFEVHTFLVDLACAQHDELWSWLKRGDWWCSLQDLTFLGEKNEVLEWCHKLPFDKADTHQFVREQNGLNKTAAPNIRENLHHLIGFEVITVVVMKSSVS
jgi:hypothetical protein